MHRDNGSTWSGVLMAFAVIAALVSGYYLRDAGYVVNIDQPTQEVKPK